MGRVAFCAVVVGVCLFDHATKWLALEFLPGNDPISIIPGLFALKFETNPGGAFSLLADRPKLLMAVATASLAFIVWFAMATPAVERVMRLGFALLVGGATANLIDRLTRGHVIDFFDAYWGDAHFPTFNIADSAICIGAGLVVLRSFMAAPEPAADAPAGGAPSSGEPAASPSPAARGSATPGQRADPSR